LKHLKPFFSKLQSYFWFRKYVYFTTAFRSFCSCAKKNIFNFLKVLKCECKCKELHPTAVARHSYTTPIFDASVLQVCNTSNCTFSAFSLKIRVNWPLTKFKGKISTYAISYYTTSVTIIFNIQFIFVLFLCCYLNYYC